MQAPFLEALHEHITVMERLKDPSERILEVAAAVIDTFKPRRQGGGPERVGTESLRPTIIVPLSLCIMMRRIARPSSSSRGNWMASFSGTPMSPGAAAPAGGMRSLTTYVTKESFLL